MYKVLCAAAILLASVTLAPFASASGLPSPVIVAKGKLTNQTAPIPAITLFTPTQTGLYRLSVYAALLKSNPASNSNWNYNVTWTDDSGVTNNSNPVLYAFGYQNPGIFFSNLGGTFAGPALTLVAGAGTPITYSMTQSGPPDSSAYSLYWVLERLE